MLFAGETIQEGHQAFLLSSLDDAIENYLLTGSSNKEKAAAIYLSLDRTTAAGSRLGSQKDLDVVDVQRIDIFEALLCERLGNARHEFPIAETKDDGNPLLLLIGEFARD